MKKQRNSVSAACRSVLACVLVLAMVLSLGVAAAPVHAAQDMPAVKITKADSPLGEPVVLASGDEMTTAMDDPDEVVSVIVAVESAPVAERMGVSAADMAASATRQTVGEMQQAVLAAQKPVRSRIAAKLGSDEVTFGAAYTLLANGFVVRTARRNLDAIRAIPGVKSAFIAAVYEKPVTFAGSDSQVSALLADTAVDFDGEGMAIAVLDTGLDTAHEAFANEPENGRFTLDYIRGFLAGAQLNAETMMPGLDGKDVYVSGKIPFAFDYGCSDANVNPATKQQGADLNHGTHVAGIAAGCAVNDEGEITFAGVAPNAQILPMKVFDDSGAGASMDIIMSALEDAYLLGVDAVNMSLGIAAGYTQAEDDFVNEVYNNLRKAGIIVAVSAGNDTSSSYKNNYGTDLPLTADPENGVVSAPSTYPASFSVASVENTELYSHFFKLGDEDILFTDSTTSWMGVPSRAEYLSKLNYIPAVSEPYDYVMIPGYGTYSDYSGLDVKGKIAVVSRGGDLYGSPMTFAQKDSYASYANAIGIIIYNNDAENPDDFGITMDMNNYQVPACFVSYNVGQHLAELAGTGVGISMSEDFKVSESPKGGQMSSFSSMGVTPDLRLKPEISAVGGNVLSAVPTIGGLGSYASMSGTSMASPYVAGASVLVKEHVQSDFVGSLGDTAAAVTENLIMSTAQIITDPATNLPYSPRMQGSGMIDLAAAAESYVVLSTAPDAYNSTRPVGNLGDDAEETGVYTISFQAKNFGTDAASYAVDTVVMAPQVVEQDGRRFTGNKDAILEYTASGDTELTLAAGAQKTVSVTVALSEAQKAQLRSDYENGIFVEGYVVLKSETSADLSVPFVAFFGDWGKAGMLDYGDMLNNGDEVANTPTELGADFSILAVKLGANLSTNENVPIVGEHMTISPNGDAYLDGVEYTSVGLLRAASLIHYEVTDENGNVVWTHDTANVPRTHYYASYGAQIPATATYEYAPDPWYGTDNEGNVLPDGQYYYTITAYPVCDHETENVRNTVTFPVYKDTGAPYLNEGAVTIQKNEEGRLILGFPVCDDHMLLTAALHYVSWDGKVDLHKSPLMDNNYGLAGMEDINSTIAYVDVTSVAGTTMILRLQDWGYNITDYYIDIPADVEENVLTMSEDRIYLATGETFALYGFDATGDEEIGLTWTSSDESVATVTDGGVVTAVGFGVSVVTATNRSGLSATCYVGVDDGLEFTGLSLAFDEVVVPLYHKYTLKMPNVYLEPYGIEVPSNDVTWTVSDPALDVFYGNMTVGENTQPGAFTVTATYNGFSASFTGTVEEHTGSVWPYHSQWYWTGLNRIFTQGSTSVGVGRDAVYAFDTEGVEGQVLTGALSVEGVVDLENNTISSTANRDSYYMLADEGFFMQAVAPGTTVLTATAAESTGDTTSWMVTVLPARYTGIEATETHLNLHVGDAVDVGESVALLGENVLAEYNPVFYTSFDPEVASVDENGELTALAAGECLVRVMLNTGDYVLVAVHVEGEEAPVNPFVDVPDDAWYLADVLWAVENGITTGVSEDKFAPNADCDRSQVVTFLWRAAGQPEPKGTAAGFSDVKESDWYYKAVMWAVEQGITSGTGNGLFSPKKACTRAEVVTFLWRAAGMPECSEPAVSFSDVKESAWYYNAVMWAVENEITNGVGNGSFAPNTVCTRSQVVAFLHRAVK